MNLACITFSSTGTWDCGMKRMVLSPLTRFEGSRVLLASCAHLCNSLEKDVHQYLHWFYWAAYQDFIFSPVTPWFIWFIVLVVVCPWLVIPVPLSESLMVAWVGKPWLQDLIRCDWWLRSYG